LTSAKSFWSVSLDDDFSSVLASADFSTFVAEAAFFFSSASYPSNSSLVLGNSLASKFLSFCV